jgi:hypothetical protein
MNLLKRNLLLSTLLLAWSGAAPAQVLASLEPLDRIRPGVTKADDVRSLLGAPARTQRFPSRGIETMEYDARAFGQRINVSIAIGSDGTVRDIQRLQLSGP